MPRCSSWPTSRTCRGRWVQMPFERWAASLGRGHAARFASCIGTPYHWRARHPVRHVCALPPALQALQLDALVGRQWSIVACSAVDGSGLLEGFDWLVKDIAARIYLLE